MSDPSAHMRCSLDPKKIPPVSSHIDSPSVGKIAPLKYRLFVFFPLRSRGEKEEEGGRAWCPIPSFPIFILDTYSHAARAPSPSSSLSTTRRPPLPLSLLPLRLFCPCKLPQFFLLLPPPFSFLSDRQKSTTHLFFFPFSVHVWWRRRYFGTYALTSPQKKHMENIAIFAGKEGRRQLLFHLTKKDSDPQL